LENERERKRIRKGRTSGKKKKKTNRKKKKKKKKKAIFNAVGCPGAP
jgi:hypothetical protein